MSGLLVWQCELMRMPPRSPTARPAARASSSRGRMPAENTMMSVSRRGAVGEHQAVACARSPVDDFLRVLRQVHRARRALRSSCAAAGRRNRRAAPPSGATRTRPRASRGRGPSAPWPPPGRAARRRSPCRPSSARARRGDHLEVLDRAVDEAVAPVASRHRRHERDTSRWRAPACRRAPRGSAPSARPCSTGSIESTRSFRRSVTPAFSKNFFVHDDSGRRPSCRRRSS